MPLLDQLSALHREILKARSTYPLYPFDTSDSIFEKGFDPLSLNQEVFELKGKIYSEAKDPQTATALRDLYLGVEKSTDEWTKRLCPPLEPSLESIRRLRETIAPLLKNDGARKKLASSIKKIEESVTQLHWFYHGDPLGKSCLDRVVHQNDMLQTIAKYFERIDSLEQEISESIFPDQPTMLSLYSSDSTEAREKYSFFIHKIRDWQLLIQKFQKALSGFHFPEEQARLATLSTRVAPLEQKYSYLSLIKNGVTQLREWVWTKHDIDLLKKNYYFLKSVIAHENKRYDEIDESTPIFPLKSYDTERTILNQLTSSLEETFLLMSSRELD